MPWRANGRQAQEISRGVSVETGSLVPSLSPRSSFDAKCGGSPATSRQSWGSGGRRAPQGRRPRTPVVIAFPCTLPCRHEASSLAPCHAGTRHPAMLRRSFLLHLPRSRLFDERHLRSTTDLRMRHILRTRTWFLINQFGSTLLASITIAGLAWHSCVLQAGLSYRVVEPIAPRKARDIRCL
jgi:hypothetical protein